MINTSIEWCHHTLNLWQGCFRVSPGCNHCYAEVMNNRFGGGHWKATGPRQWKEPKTWKAELRKAQRSAQKAGQRQSVFVMSMGDIFEKPQPLRKQKGFGIEMQYTDMEITTGDVRDEFFAMIPQFPELVFLLLTKRPGNIEKYVPHHWYGNCPENVWFGCSVTDQSEWDMNIPKLAIAPGTGNKFVSMEPLLGSVNIRSKPKDFLYDYNPHWIIVGGESGHHARPMKPEWVGEIRGASTVMDIPFMFKQWGKWMPTGDVDLNGQPVMIKAKGAKHKGRSLNGKEYNGVPDWGPI